MSPTDSAKKIEINTPTGEGEAEEVGFPNTFWKTIRHWQKGRNLEGRYKTWGASSPQKAQRTNIKSNFFSFFRNSRELIFGMGHGNEKRYPIPKLLEIFRSVRLPWSLPMDRPKNLSFLKKYFSPETFILTRQDLKRTLDVFWHRKVFFWIRPLSRDI